MLPPLVSITGAPNPFLPWIDDDIKDETRISYTLEAPSDPTSSVSTAPTRTGSAAAPSCSSRTTGRTRQGSTSTSGTAGPRNREVAPPEGRLLRQDPSRGSVDHGGRLEALQGLDRADLSGGEDEDEAREGLPPERLDPIVIGGGCFVMEEAGDLRILCQGGAFPCTGDGASAHRNGSSEPASWWIPSGELSEVHPSVRASSRILVHRERGSGRGVGRLPHRHGEDHVQLRPSILTRRFPGRPAPTITRGRRRSSASGRCPRSCSTTSTGLAAGHDRGARGRDRVRRPPDATWTRSRPG